MPEVINVDPHTLLIPVWEDSPGRLVGRCPTSGVLHRLEMEARGLILAEKLPAGIEILPANELAEKESKLRT